jgi:hypothetical protein
MEGRARFSIRTHGRTHDYLTSGDGRSTKAEALRDAHGAMGANTKGHEKKGF